MNQIIKIKFYLNKKRECKNQSQIVAACLTHDGVSHTTGDIRIAEHCFENTETCIVISYRTVTERNTYLVESLQSLDKFDFYEVKEIEINAYITVEHYGYIYINQNELFNLLNLN